MSTTGETGDEVRRQPVVVADINGEGAERLAADLNARHGDKTAMAVQIDLRNEAEIARLVQRTVDYFGSPNVLVNNAGIFPGDDGDVANMAIEVWDNVLAVNVRAAMLLTKHALPHLRQSGGSIINTASTHAFAGDTSLTGYGAATAALVALTKYTATQYGKEGVRCNTVCPGTTTTPPALTLPESIKDIYRNQTMAPSLNGPSELGKVYLFLASDESRGINGDAIKVDGGLLAHQPFVADMRALGMSTV